MALSQRDKAGDKLYVLMHPGTQIQEAPLCFVSTPVSSTWVVVFLTGAASVLFHSVLVVPTLCIFASPFQIISLVSSCLNNN